MGPDCLNGLTVSHPDAIHVCEIEVGLAGRPMASDVELRNRDTERVEGLDIKRRHGSAVGETVIKIFRPLTTDVVGHNDILDPSINLVCKSRCNSVINVYVPKCDS